MFELPCRGLRPMAISMLLGLFLWPICDSGPVFGQLSPGKLSRPHSHLEGLKNCGNCHSLGDRRVLNKCLECHDEIAVRREAGRGLHGRAEYTDCTDCHVEHQGEDYELIFWPQGIEGFDHVETGFPLIGRHAELACRSCHLKKFNYDADRWEKRGKDLGRTYLGLDETCVSCHEDLHRGQFPPDCTACHTTVHWRPASGFDHERTRFPLTGRHRSVGCVRCHPPLPGEGPAAKARLYAGVDFQVCSDCHQDPHGGRLGPNCVGCHTTVGWREVDVKTFDHDRTRYPLRGRHARLRCRQCHYGDRKRPAFTACNDCHADAHGSQALGKLHLLRCEDCHDVQGFRPANFTFERHARTAYPLRGAHQAVPCDLCHRTESAEAGMPVNLAPPHQGCLDCHADPHRGQAARFAGEAGCTQCHVQDSWAQVSFDHGLTAFQLTGRHLLIPCRACHLPLDDKPGSLRLVGTPTACAVCHQDPHAGQFQDKLTADGRHVACDRCHVTRDWLAELFDHGRDSRFPLRGGHEKVACTACHPPAAGTAGGLLQFKPLPIRCSDCHTQKFPGPEGSDD